MKWLLSGALGLIFIGPPGVLVAIALVGVEARLRRPRAPEPPSLSTVLILLLVELRSGVSVLAALTSVSRALPHDRALRRVARVANLDGLERSVELSDERLYPALAHLARSQRTGASAAETLRRHLEEVITSNRARRIERARTLPVKLMIPVTLLMLPGLVLLLYAPGLLRMFSNLTGGLG